MLKVWGNCFGKRKKKCRISNFLVKFKSIIDFFLFFLSVISKNNFETALIFISFYFIVQFLTSLLD